MCFCQGVCVCGCVGVIAGVRLYKSLTDLSNYWKEKKKSFFLVNFCHPGNCQRPKASELHIFGLHFPLLNGKSFPALHSFGYYWTK